MRTIVALASLALLSALAPRAGAATAQSPEEEQRSWTVFAGTLYTAAGAPIENALITVEGGAIAGVSGGARAPEGERALRAAAVTPGMVDASVRIDRGFHSVEQSREVTPEVRVAGAIDLFDEAWKRQARSGVTTALASPPDFNVIGGLGIVLKTAGPPSLEARTVKADAVLRGSLGSQPSQRNHPAFGRPTDFYSRRPTTRMGVEWELRKAFYDAAAARGDSERAFTGSDVLGAVLSGEIPLMLQAWTTQDIRTAVYLAEEIEREGLGRPRVIIDAAAEAWKEPQLLVRSGVSVVLPPFPPEGRTDEGAFMAWDTAQLLRSKGVPVALSSHGERDPARRLDRQAGFAMRGGLSFEEALAAVTIAPARMLGVEERVGTLEAGKDADLVLWSGRPFETGSRVIGVLVDGRLVLDPRNRAN